MQRGCPGPPVLLTDTAASKVNNLEPTLHQKTLIGGPEAPLLSCVTEFPKDKTKGNPVAPPPSPQAHAGSGEGAALRVPEAPPLLALGALTASQAPSSVSP